MNFVNKYVAICQKICIVKLFSNYSFNYFFTKNFSLMDNKDLVRARLIVGLLGFAVITSLWLVNVVPLAFAALLDLVFIGAVAKLHIEHALVVSTVAAVFLLLGLYCPLLEIWPPMLVYRGGTVAVNLLFFVNIILNTVIYVIIAVVVLLAGGFAYLKLRNKNK